MGLLTEQRTTRRPMCRDARAPTVGDVTNDLRTQGENMKSWSTYRVMGSLLIADVALLVVSGVPAFKHADGGWRNAVGLAAWIGFMAVSVVLLAVAAVAIVRHRRSTRSDRTPKQTTTADSYTGGRAALWGAAALVAAIVADLLEAVLDPVNSGEGSRFVAAAHHDHGIFLVSAYLLLASALFLFPGVYGLARGIKGRGSRLGRAGIVVAFLGSLGHAALAAVYLVFAAMPGQGTTDAQLITAIDRVNDSASVAPLAIGFFAFPVSMLLLFAGLLRARVAPRWVVVPVVAAPIAAIAASGEAGTSTALVLLLVATAAVTVRIVRGTPVRRDEAERGTATVGEPAQAGA
jgi:hypothetical protein